jgi:hypothetical protein
MKKPSLHPLGHASLCQPKREVRNMADNQKLFERIRKSRGGLLRGFKFDRQDANERSR